MDVAQISLRNMDEDIVFLIPMDLMGWIESQSLNVPSSGSINVQIPNNLVQELGSIWPINSNFNASFRMTKTAINDAMLHLATQMSYVENGADIYEKAKEDFIIQEEYNGFIY